MLQIKYSKNIYFLDWGILLLPLSMIVGNAAININCLIIILLFFTNLFKKKIKLIRLDKTTIIIFLLFLFFSLNIYFSANQKISLVSFLGIIKYMLLVAAILYCCKNIESFILRFSKLIFIILILVCLDTLLQFFRGTDIFGYSSNPSHGMRLSGPFGDEYIVGSFIGKFALISLFYLNKKNFFYEYVSLLTFLIIVFLSNERAASIMCFFSMVAYFLLSPNLNFKMKLINFISLALLIVFLFNINTQLKKHFIERTFQQFAIVSGNEGGDYEHESFWDSRWGAHFLTAVEINKNYPLLGSGLHTYRIECLNKKYEKINSIRVNERCNTHPHNIYLEIWSELGTLFFIFFVIFNIYFLFKLFKVYFFNKKYQQEASIIISLYFMLFFPIQTTGSLFSTWNGLIYWILIALCLNLFTNSIKKN